MHQIAPAQNKATELSSSGSVALGWHTDMGILQPEFRPEFLTLIGLRNEASTPTLICDLAQALSLLWERDAVLAEVLRQPRFRVESPASLLWHGGKSLRSEPRPLVSTQAGYDAIAGNLQTISTTDSCAREALEALQSAVEALARPIVIAPGQVLQFNNSRVLHGRPAIQRGERWLQRVYSLRTLEPLRQATASPEDAVVFSIAQVILQ